MQRRNARFALWAIGESSSGRMRHQPSPIYCVSDGVAFLRWNAKLAIKPSESIWIHWIRRDNNLFGMTAALTFEPLMFAFD
jgi:uncharacterized protein YfaT (DUF1175 family)